MRKIVIGALITAATLTAGGVAYAGTYDTPACTRPSGITVINCADAHELVHVTTGGDLLPVLSGRHRRALDY